MEKAATLKAASIPFSIIENKSAGSEVTFTQLPSDFFELKVPYANQEQAIQLLNEKYNSFQVKEDYLLQEFKYLLSYSNEELTDIVRKKDEWSENAIDSALLILHERGVRISQEEKFLLWKKRNKELRKGEAMPGYIILTGYIFCLLTGIVGLLTGILLSTLKKKDLFGKEYFVYEKQTRQHGRLMIVTGSILWLGYLFLLYMMKY